MQFALPVATVQSDRSRVLTTLRFEGEARERERRSYSLSNTRERTASRTSPRMILDRAGNESRVMGIELTEMRIVNLIRRACIQAST
jgi:hypothetical protein